MFSLKNIILIVNIDHGFSGYEDKYESNHTGDGQTDGQTRTEVRTGKIYEFIRSNVITPGLTERRTLMTRVSHNVGH